MHKFNPWRTSFLSPHQKRCTLNKFYSETCEKHCTMNIWLPDALIPKPFEYVQFE
jgi:hypothetical protein